jgi:hypothetical protein
MRISRLLGLGFLLLLGGHINGGLRLHCSFAPEHSPLSFSFAAWIVELIQALTYDS